MAKTLFVIIDATGAIVNEDHEIDLRCINDQGKTLAVKISTVILRIDHNDDPETFTVLNQLSEGQLFGLDEETNIEIISATKIYNPCTEETIYVREYVNDISPFLNCCTGDLPGNIGGGDIPDDLGGDDVPDGPGNSPAVSNKINFAVKNDTYSGTVIDAHFKFSGNHNVNIIWGDGFTTSLSGGSEYFTTHVYTEPNLYPATIEFENETELTELKLDGGHITGLSGLENYVNLTKLSLNDNLLTALPTYPGSLTELKVNANKIEDLGDLSALLLTVLECAANLVETLTIPTTLERLVASGNPNLISFDLDGFTVLEFLDLSNCDVFTLIPTVENSVKEIYCNDCAIGDFNNIPTSLEVLNAAGNVMEAVSINAIITAIEGNAIDNGILNLEDQTPAAIPTATTEISNLVARGWEITTD